MVGRWIECIAIPIVPGDGGYYGNTLYFNSAFQWLVSAPAQGIVKAKTVYFCYSGCDDTESVYSHSLQPTCRKQSH